MSKVRDVSNGFLTRLARNEAGNVIAMTAAAVFPLIGLVGGAIDMARIYTVRSRLQAACDSGALAGRRVMGTGRWSDNSNRANTVALQTFDLNFNNGTFGSTNRVRSFEEQDGTVTGTASADIPMTLMRVLGVTQKSVSVTCEGMMRIPNTDVMFVLDNSGSMDELIPGDSTGLTKIQGLRTAIRCFYEALAKEDVTEVSPSDCGTTSNPTAGLSSQVQLRFGFVNYDHMVNVGKLLPQNFMADQWTYQSRTPNMETVNTWTLGTQTAIDWDDWTPADTPTSYRRASNYGSFSSINSSGSTTVGGVSKLNKDSANSSQCSSLNTYAGSELVGVNESTANGSITSTPTDNDPPVHPANQQNISSSQNATVTVTGFRYRWSSRSGTNACYLEKATANSTYTKTRSGTSSKPITWTSYERIASWTYRPVDFDVSSLKGSSGDWNGSVSLPLGESPVSVKLSGSNSTSTIKLLTNVSVAWNGCIEERQTYQNTSGNPNNDWLNYPSSPADAFDMDIDRTPTTGDVATQWRPALHTAVWGRKETLSGTSWGGNATTSWVTAAPPTNNSTPGRNLSFNNCVTPSRLLTNYNGRSGNPSVSDFSTYVGSIVPNGNTYHDIGLLWGARLMSPTGIFAADNATTPGGAQITRHMIFMTDGATANNNVNYDSYGVAWWDRRQFNVAASATQMQNNNNARANALCTAIKNKNITLWVISYGNSVDTTTMNRLKACATSISFFYSAANTTALITKFREIADKISNLRLTN